MSNTKRDWEKENAPDYVWDALMDGTMNESINALCDWAVSVRDRELAGEVEKMLIRMPTREGRVFNEAIEKVLALLSPQNDTEDTPNDNER